MFKVRNYNPNIWINFKERSNKEYKKNSGIIHNAFLFGSVLLVKWCLSTTQKENDNILLVIREAENYTATEKGQLYKQHYR